MPNRGSRPPLVRAAPRGHFNPRLVGSGVAIALVLGGLFVWTSLDRSVATAEEILQRVEATAQSPGSAGIQQLAVEQHFVMYFISGDARDVPSAEGRFRAWYEAPNRQRLESSYTEYARSGDALSEDRAVLVWDGTDYWKYDTEEHTAHVLRQDPNADVYDQGVLFGVVPAQASVLDTSCRTATVTGDEEVIGRTADVVEVSRPTCGFTLPGADGHIVLWVDQDTGLILKSAQYAIDGQLVALREVTSLEINGAIDGDLLTFAPPSDADIEDDRDQPLGMGTGFRITPRSLSLDEARALTTFPLRVPETLPAGFELSSVQLWWPGVATESRPTVTNDWVLLRYEDDDGNWLLISQGFGGLLNGLATVAPADIPQGKIDVRGTEATWIDGSPWTRHWEPGTMRLLRIDVGRVGSGWAIDPDGETVFGSPLHIALASNALTVEELVEIAEALE